MRFVVQEHFASTHHFDFRLEKDGVLKSWAVPKGMPAEHGQRRLALHTDGHDLSFAEFEGTIEEGEYGAGEIQIWDRGTYEPEEWGEERIVFTLHGNRLQGRYGLIRFRRKGQREWLIQKYTSTCSSH